MLCAKLVDSTDELKQILELQNANLKRNLTPTEIQEQGFVSIVHTLAQLSQLHAAHPSIIVKDDYKLAGYALIMLPELAAVVPVLGKAFEAIEIIKYNDRLLKDTRWYLMGQICIAKQYRGQGLFQQLYYTHRDMMRKKYQLCITEISTSNPRSLRAHEKIGFKTIHTFRDDSDEWATVVWDWS
jgi:GNAT superfamily N-acetyltransferase